MNKLLITLLFLGVITGTKNNPVGIDVSHHQGEIKWEEVAKTRGLKYVYIKASEGASYTDDMFKTNIKNAKNAGLLVGAYHFYSEKSDIVSQFEHFKSLYPKDCADLIPMLDVEPRGKVDSKRIRNIRNDIKVFQKLCLEYYGCEAMLYIEPLLTERGWLAQLIDGNTILCIGHPYKKAPKLHGKAKYTIWQFTYSGRINGIRGGVDMHKLNSGVTVDNIRIK